MPPPCRHHAAQAARSAGLYLVGEGHQVDAQSDPGFGHHGKDALEQQLALAAAGIGLLASYRPNSSHAEFVSQLAKFLVGAGEGQFFGAGSWTVSRTSREGVAWHKEYDLPLGPPLGNATLARGGVYTRAFASGTNATYHSATDTGTIEWGSW